MDACTIVSPRELARARVLAATLARHAPEWRLTVLLLSEEAPAEEGFAVLGLSDLAGVDEWGLIAAANPPGALAMALVPLLVRALFARGVARGVVYLGAGLRVLGGLLELQEMTRSNQTVLVARAQPLDDRGGTFAAEADAGAFSSAVIGFGAVPAVLFDGWPRAFASGLDGGETALSRWLAGLPALSADVAILRDPAYGLDPLTLGSLPLAEDDGCLQAAGRHAQLIDLTELDPLDPPACFVGDGRARLSTAPPLRALVQRHAADLLAAGYERDRGRPAGFERLPDGTRLSPIVSELVAGAIRDRALDSSPFTDAGRKQLYAYLNAPAKQGAHAGLTRLHLAIWRASPELQEGYRHLTGPDGTGFAGWICAHAADQLGLAAGLLPPAPDVAFRDADPHKHLLGARWGVNVVGFFTAELGVGEAARLVLRSLDARSIPALPIQGNLAPPSRQGAEHWFARPDQAPYPINVICINGDGVSVFAREAGRSFFKDRYTVALWFWEVGAPPADWRAAYEFVDEVWVASQHVYDAIAPLSPVPVVRIKLPVTPPETVPASRAELGLPEEGFLFLYVHDYHSVAARKNPEGLIEAFRRAFEPGSGAQLVIKSINASTRPAEHERIVLAAAGRPDITLIDGYVSAAEKNAIIARCDCYVSLHRSEGFGLTVAEALLLERPVIATRFGGTQDFLDDSNAFLVDWQPTPVGEGAYPYPVDGIWAEPDIEQAAALMRTVFGAPDLARIRAREGRKRLLEHYSPAAAGAAIERRLRFIHDERLSGRARALDLAQLPPALGGSDGDGAQTLREHLRTLEAHQRDLQESRHSVAGERALEARIAEVPQLVMGSGLKYSARAKLMRPLVTWARAYSEHQADLERDLQREILELEEHVLRRIVELDERMLSVDERMLRLDEHVREVGRSLQDDQQELRAQLLARLRQLEDS